MTAEEFAARVDEAFARIIEQHRLQPNASLLGVKFVRRLVGEATVLDIAWDYAGRRELSFTLELVSPRDAEDSDSDRLEVGQALAAVGAPLTDISAFPSGLTDDDPEALSRLLRKAAGLLESYGGDLIEGAGVAWEAALRQSASGRPSTRGEVVNGPAVRAAEEAWQARDFARVVALLGPIESDLSARDGRRLDYARSQRA